MGEKRDRFDEMACDIVDIEFTSGDMASVWLMPRDSSARCLYSGGCHEVMPEVAALQREIAEAIRGAVAAERERCAGIADAHSREWLDIADESHIAARPDAYDAASHYADRCAEIAASIRSADSDGAG